MGTEDLIDHHASCNSGCKSENDSLHNSNFGPSDADSQPINSEAKEDKLNKISGTADVDDGNGGSKPILATNMDEDLIGTSSVLQGSVELNDIVAIAEDGKSLSSGIRTENGCVTVRDASPFSNRKRGGSPISNHEIDDSLNGCLRSYYSSGRNGMLNIVLHLMIPLKGWNLVKGRTSLHFVLVWIILLQWGLEIIDSSRCFNCGSYNHSLKECPKPRDNKAVNNARKQQKSRRNQKASSRHPIRYYQNSLGGKYDGLRPGVLDVETRQLLGVGELDPPPWLNRMREIGYPPGYLDAEYDDQPSGIAIFADEESRGEKEDGEILDTPEPPPKKMSVQFPGINAPIPANADERRWTGGPSSFELSRDRSPHILNHSSELISRGQYHGQRRSRDFRDEGPPGCDPGLSPTLSSYSPRYGGYDSSYTPHYEGGRIPIPGSHSFGRTLSERGRRSPLVHEDSSNTGSHNSITYSPSGILFSPPSYGSARSEKRDNDSWNDFNPNFSSHHKDKQQQHHHHHCHSQR